MRFPILLLTLSLAAAAVASAQVGSVVRTQQVNPSFGGFTGALDDFDGFGIALAPLPDVNGDGTLDLAVGAEGDDDGGTNRGAVWILFLRPDATVLGQQKISETVGGFTGALTDGSAFGRQVAAVGDLDGNGITELAVLSRAPNRLWILFLAADGTVTSTRENLFSDPVFGPGAGPEPFALAPLAALGDLDGDGLGDLAIGAPYDHDGAYRAGAVWITRLRADGGFKAAHKISATQGGFTGAPYDEGNLGAALVHMGDLNGDGHRELGVLAPYGPPFTGTMWILYLDADERVASQAGFQVGYRYGLAFPHTYFYPTRHLGWLGDIDGDGDGELVQGFPWNYPGGPQNEGAIAIGSVEPNGDIRGKVRITHERGGLGAVPAGTNLGHAFAPLGDLDGDGTPELAVGTPYERIVGGLRPGGIWILSLATNAVRNGSGANPVNLVAFGEPLLGLPWTLSLDCGAHAPGAGFLLGRSAAVAPLPTPVGELLVGGQSLFVLQGAHTSDAVPFQMLVPPYEAALIDLPVHVQGLCTGAPGPRLGNALDFVLGRW